MRIGGSNDWMSGFGGQRPAVRAPRAFAAQDPAAATPDAGPQDQQEPQAPAPVPAPQEAAPIAARPSSEDPNLFHRPKDENAKKPVVGDRLTPDQEAEVTELRHRDAEVRAHEAAHAAAAGALGGGASFEYQTGPDGRNYAIGGEVPVEMAAGHTPEETIRNAAQLRAAALAPAQPSAQDRAVAAEASAMEAAARAEIAARSANPPQPAAAPAMQGPGAPAPAPDRRIEIAPTDPARLIQQLEIEQRTSRAGWRHLHSGAGCGSCGQAVAAYR